MEGKKIAKKAKGAKKSNRAPKACPPKNTRGEGDTELGAKKGVFSPNDSGHRSANSAALARKGYKREKGVSRVLGKGRVTCAKTPDSSMETRSTAIFSK